jgi:aminopeptidase-like protein
MRISGDLMYKWAREIYSYPRSLTGDGVRYTLNYLKSLLPNLEMIEIQSGTKVFDWTVPQEWTINEAWIKSKNGIKLVDWSHNNLHVVGYSTPVHRMVKREELLEHLHSIPEKPKAIPYVTSYYKPMWGFCLTHETLLRMNDPEYEVYIDSHLFDGVMNIGELFIPGRSTKELLLTTYICHPSMGNNEVSGPVVATALARTLSELGDLPYSVRVVFAPETIGAIVYIHKNLERLKSSVVAALNITCVGDDNAFSFLPTKYGDAYTDKLAEYLIEGKNYPIKRYCWLDRGSDERQYCSPHVDLPMVSLMRSKYNEYEEYHTSLDNMEYISPTGLAGGFQVNFAVIDLLMRNHIPVSTKICEPHLSKYCLYNFKASSGVEKRDNRILNFLTFADGRNDFIDIARLANLKFDDVCWIANELRRHELIYVKCHSDPGLELARV